MHKDGNCTVQWCYEQMHRSLPHYELLCFMILSVSSILYFGNWTTKYSYCSISTSKMWRWQRYGPSNISQEEYGHNNNDSAANCHSIGSFNRSTSVCVILQVTFKYLSYLLKVLYIIVCHCRMDTRSKITSNCLHTLDQRCVYFSVEKDDQKCVKNIQGW